MGLSRDIFRYGRLRLCRRGLGGRIRRIVVLNDFETLSIRHCSVRELELTTRRRGSSDLPV